MRNHFARSQGTEASALGQIETMGVAVEKSGREQIPSSGGVDHMWHVVGRNVDDLLTIDDGRPEWAPGDDSQRTVASHRRYGCFEIVDFVERQQFLFVPEQDVDFVFDQRTEIGPMTVHTETVRQAEGHLSIRVVCDTGSAPECQLGIVAIEEIALHVEDLSGGHEIGIDITGFHERRHAQIGVHRALRIGSHHDDATTRWYSVELVPRSKMHSNGTKVVTEDVAEIVVTNFADVCRSTTETGDATHGVRSRSSAHFDGSAEFSIQVKRPIGIDESHRTLHQFLMMDEVLVRVGDHVHQSISDSDDIE